MQHYDVAVIGAGIVGLAHAWMAARRGLKVVIFERSAQAHGASVRNFGMIWPIGQPPGALHQTAMQSRELWREIAAASGLWLNECGSLHLAYREDELAVLEEFATHASTANIDVVIKSPTEIARLSPAAKPTELLAGMYSDSEMCVNPRAAIMRIPQFLRATHEVDLRFCTQIVDVDEKTLKSSDGQTWTAERIIICSGYDLQTLLPETFRDSGIRICKLQMLKAVPQPDGWRIGPHLAGGLTLRHYSSFDDCESLTALRARVAAETPELDQYGIHVMASQNELGEVILGDSHEYDDAITPFDSAKIDELIMRELRKMIVLEDWTIAERWHGLYAKHPTKPIFEAKPRSNLHVFVAPGGAGMTMSFGLAHEAWERWN